MLWCVGMGWGRLDWYCGRLWYCGRPWYCGVKSVGAGKGLSGLNAVDRVHRVGGVVRGEVRRGGAATCGLVWRGVARGGLGWAGVG